MKVEYSLAVLGVAPHGGTTFFNLGSGTKGNFRLVEKIIKLFKFVRGEQF